jgi:hypothetical protein
MTLEGWGYLPLLLFHFLFSRLEVSQEQILVFQLNEGGRAMTFVIVRILLYFNAKFIVCILFSGVRFIFLVGIFCRWLPLQWI